MRRLTVLAVSDTVAKCRLKRAAIARYGAATPRCGLRLPGVAVLLVVLLATAGVACGGGSGGADKATVAETATGEKATVTGTLTLNVEGGDDVVRAERVGLDVEGAEENSPTYREVKSDAKGAFEFRNVEPGNYQLSTFGLADLGKGQLDDCTAPGFTVDVTDAEFGSYFAISDTFDVSPGGTIVRDIAITCTVEYDYTWSE